MEMDSKLAYQLLLQQNKFWYSSTENTGNIVNMPPLQPWNEAEMG